jgi:hypothetical protein
MQTIGFMNNLKNKTMKYRLNSLLAAISILLLMTSCYHDEYFPCIRPAGPVFEETRITSAFNAVSVSINAEVYIDYAPQHSIVIVGAGNILDEVSTSTYGRTLHIDNIRCIRNRSTDIVIYITTPEITSVKLNSSGNIFIENFEGERVKFELPGSGNINSSGLDFGKVHTVLSGSGNITLSGATYDHIVQITGSGNVSSYNLFAQEALVQVSGSGTARVNVVRFIDAQVSGSGRIFYKGNPRAQILITGSGSVSRAS